MLATSRIGVPVRRHGPRRAQGGAGGRERHGERRGKARRGPDAAARDHVALPHERGDPEQARREEDRDRDVAAGREDRRGSPPDEQPDRLRNRQREADRIEHEMDVPLDRSQGSQDEPAQRDRRRRDEPILEPAPAPDPGQLSPLGSVPECGRDGQRGVDVTPGSPGRDQQPHRSSVLRAWRPGRGARVSLARWTAGCLPRRS